MELFFISEDTTISNTVDWITKISMKGIAHPDCIEIADRCKESADPLKTLFNIAYDSITYEPEELTTQTLRTMNNIITGGKGNCVHYTTLISAVLILLQEPHYRKVVSYDKPNVYEHIYIETEKGIILDPVLNQRQDGSDTYYRPDCGEFNKEKPFKYKKLYYMPKLQILNGTKDQKETDTNSNSSRTRMVRQMRYYNSMGCTKNAIGCGLGCSCMAVKNNK